MSLYNPQKVSHFSRKLRDFRSVLLVFWVSFFWIPGLTNPTTKNWKKKRDEFVPGNSLWPPTGMVKTWPLLNGCWVKWPPTGDQVGSRLESPVYKGFPYKTSVWTLLHQNIPDLCLSRCYFRECSHRSVGLGLLVYLVGAKNRYKNNCHGRESMAHIGSMGRWYIFTHMI